MTLASDRDPDVCQTTVPIKCAKCLRAVTVNREASDYRCPHCKAKIAIRQCTNCGTACQTLGSGWYVCPACSHKTTFPKFGSGPSKATAGQHYDVATELGLYRERSEEERQKYTILCAHCKKRVIVEGWAEVVACPHCKKKSAGRGCVTCQAPNLTAAIKPGDRWQCRWCMSFNRVPEGERAVGRSVRDYVAELERRGLIGDDPNRTVLQNFTVLSAFGHEVPKGTVCSVALLTNGLIVSPSAPGTDVASYPIEDLLEIEIGGPGMVTTGGGFRGGGVGSGAIEGMEMAYLLNKLTTKTTISNVLRIVTKSSGYVFHNDTYNPSSLRQAFDVISARLLQLQSVPQPPVSSVPISDDTLAELAKLGQLRDSGILTDEEFQAAKAKLLARLA